MKKILYTLVAFAILFSSCDIDRTPEWRQDETKVTPESFDMILNGCYAQIKGWADVMHRVREYPADNIVIRGSSTDKFFPFISYLPTEDNYRLDAYWGNSLKVIQRTSTMINSTALDGDDVINNKIGEAYYLRGLCYFYMVNTWGRPYYQSPETNLGVPIINKYDPLNDDPKTLPDRSTVKQVYDQAIADMQKAAQLMNSPRGAAYASKEAAWAMLSRIYLYMGGTWDAPVTANNELAIKYADSVINSGRYSLLPYDNFKNYNVYAPTDEVQKETIFAISHVAVDYPNDYYSTIGSMYASIQGQGWGEMYASESYLQLLKQSTRNSVANGGVEDARQNFIKPQYALNSAGDKIPAFRFIVDSYELKNGTPVKNGYQYIQGELNLVNGIPKQPYEFTDTHKDPETGAIVAQNTYVLEPTSIPEEYIVRNYKVYQVLNKVMTHCGTQNSQGEVEYLMQTNRTYPMWYVYKCSQQNYTVHLYSPIVSRLAEMYLNKAEAYFKNNDNPNALSNLNVIRRRATGSEYSAAEFAGNERKLISDERRLEFAFEAHRTLDVYRNGETMYRDYPGPHYPLRAYPATSSRVVQYIPQNEINAYPVKLTQNVMDVNDHITIP